MRFSFLAARNPVFRFESVQPTVLTTVLGSIF